MKNLMKMGMAFFAASCAVIMSSCSSSEGFKTKSDMELYELSGNVSTVRYIPYLASADENGNVVKGAIEFSPENKFIQFDGNGMAVKVRTYGPDLSVLSTELMDYNSKGKIVKSSLTGRDGNVFEEKHYKYDGNLLDKVTWTDAKGVFKKEAKYEYFGSDSVKISNYNDKMEMTGYNIERYSSDGIRNGFSSYSVNGTRSADIKIKLDPKGREQEIVSTGLTGNSSSEVTYGNHGLVSSIDVTAGSNNILQEYEYEFDENGNWIKKTVFNTVDVKKVPVRIITREIYYVK